MSRKEIFDCVRLFAPDQKFTPPMVEKIDELADLLGYPRDVHAGVNGLMKTSPKGLALIHSFESCVLTAYADPGSADGHPWTIGWGSTGPGISRGVTWTQAQADTRFAEDLAKFERGVFEALDGAPVTQHQFDALVSFSYNVGLGALKSSTLLKKHKAKDYAGAKAEFAKWINNAGRPMKGLIRRRAAEAALYGS